MHTFSRLIEAVQAGHRPVVQFNPGIGELEGYAEKGMWARVVEAYDTGNGLARVTFDFTEFDERNRAFETACFRKEGGGAQTARQAGHYRPQDDLPFDIGGDIAIYFSVERTKALALFRSYIESGAQQGYVPWLEECVATAFANLARDLPIQQPEPSSESKSPYASTPPAAQSNRIELCGPFVATSSKGISYAVQSVSVDKEAHIADVYVRLERPAAREAQLYDDDTFIASVIAQLRAEGYEGPDFGRAELGMQSLRVVTLEACKEFDAWVATKGFVQLH
jgi:hypothetical protein